MPFVTARGLNKTNIPLHRRIMEDADFLAGRVDTRFMERYLVHKKPPPAAP